ncbi:MAG TPA: SdrD B-like domain-containing protein, partial [Candidatus Angelobacter sp.]
LDGGPKGNGPSLPAGSYYVQVTEPNGALLGTSVGAINPTPFVVASDGTTNCLQLSIALIKASDSSVGYDDTTNAGGEYKVWASKDPSFPNDGSKTDNFKVNSSGQPASIGGVKFYDLNLNGVQDNGEPFINGWFVDLYKLNTSTNLYEFASDDNTHGSGTYSFTNLDPGTYGVCEVIPSAAPIWVATTALSASGVTTGTTVNFGNVCLGADSGLTLGFWSNKNGQALETASDLCFLDTLNLVNGAGAVFDPIPTGCPSPTTTQLNNGKTALRNWLLSANATNMAYMLSAQLTAMELNTLHGQNPADTLFIGANTAAACSAAGVIVTLVNPNGFTTVANLMSAANSALGVSGGNSTVAASALRTCQEALKTALDDGNNNKNFVQAQACAINYSAGQRCSL